MWKRFSNVNTHSAANCFLIAFRYKNNINRLFLSEFLAFSPRFAFACKFFYLLSFFRTRLVSQYNNNKEIFERKDFWGFSRLLTLSFKRNMSTQECKLKEFQANKNALKFFYCNCMKHVNSTLINSFC